MMESNMPIHSIHNRYRGYMKKALLIIGVIILFFVGLWQHYYVPKPLLEPEVRMIKVQVSGAVTLPGVYELNEDARVMDLIEAAGGLTEDANQDVINLAARLSDGEKVLIASGGSEFPALSQITLEQWMEIPGVGSALAKRIMDYIREHPECTLVELDNVEGVGEKKLRDILQFFEKSGGI